MDDSFIRKYMAADFEPPEYDFPVPQFSFAFPEGEKAVFKLRGICKASEYFPVLFADRDSEARQALLSAAEYSDNSEDIEPALKEIAYNTLKAKQKLEMYKALCLIGIKYPDVNRRFINFLAKNHGLLMIAIAQKIEELSSEGAVVKKKQMNSGD